MYGVDMAKPGALASPGETALTVADHVANHANMWRINDNFWDE